MALEFDPTQIPAIIAMLASAGTLGGVIKLTRWTSQHDSRVAQIEKDFDKHVVDDKVQHNSDGEQIDDLHDRIGRVEHSAGFPLHIRRHKAI